MSEDDDAKDRTLLAQTIHERLRQQILSGELAAGQPLSVPALAATMEVSRSPVREAVQRLIHEGIAVQVPYAGARVSSLDEQDIHAVFRVREVLDGLAAYEAAALIDQPTLEELAAMLTDQEQRLHAGPDEPLDTQHDLAFHALIREQSRNRPLIDALEKLEVLSHLHRPTLWDSDFNRRLNVVEHQRILSALEAGDAEGARIAASSHVSGLLTRLKRRR